MKIPDIILAHGGSEHNWNPIHDFYQGNVADKFITTTQLKWWQTNHSIRMNLDLIEQEVQDLVAQQKKIPKSIISFTNLEKRIGVSRVTICHKNRIKWVGERRRKIMESINRSQVPAKIKKEKKLKEENRELKKRLSLQRDQTIEWIEKYEMLLNEVRILRKGLTKS